MVLNKVLNIEQIDGQWNDGLVIHDYLIHGAELLLIVLIDGDLLMIHASMIQDS